MSVDVLTALPPSFTARQKSAHSPLVRLSSSGAVDMPAEAVMSGLLEAWPPKCAYVVAEILQTEEAYVNALEDILEGYQRPLTNLFRSNNKGSDLVEVVFANLDILCQVHCYFLEQLKGCCTDPHELGNAFADIEKEFQVYSEYCTSFPAAEEKLKLELQSSSVLKEALFCCQQQLGHPLPLHTYLIKPVQRITKYHLLLRELLKDFNPDHYGYDNLVRASEAMCRIASHINDVKKRRENAMRVQDIQGYVKGMTGKIAETNLSAYGDLLIEGHCKVGIRKAEREVFLFQKLLLILKKRDIKRYVYKGHLLTEELALSELLEDGSGFKVFSRLHHHRSYLIHVRSPRVLDEWVKSIETLLSEVEQWVKRRRLNLGPSTEGGEDLAVPISRARRLRRARKRRVPLSLFAARSVDEEGVKQASLRKTASAYYPSHESAIMGSESSGESLATVPSIKALSTSQESLLSLSDVEVGMERGGEGEREEGERQEEETEEQIMSLRFMEETDGASGKNKRLQRKAAIRVKRRFNSDGSSDSSDSLTSRSLIRAKARLAREDCSPPYERPLTRQPNYARESFNAKQDLEEEEEEEEVEEEGGVSMMNISDVPDPQTESCEAVGGAEGAGGVDFLIEEGSTDSEDEDAEFEASSGGNQDVLLKVPSQLNREEEEDKVLPLGDRGQGRGEEGGAVELEPNLSSPELSSWRPPAGDEATPSMKISSFFEFLSQEGSREGTPEPQDGVEHSVQGIESDVSVTAEEARNGTDESPVFHFTASSSAAESRSGTLPRRRWYTPRPVPSQSTADLTSTTLLHNTSTHSLPEVSEHRHSSGFNRLLEFTRQQTLPVKRPLLPSFDHSQSLPIGNIAMLPPALEATSPSHEGHRETLSVSMRESDLHWIQEVEEGPPLPPSTPPPPLPTAEERISYEIVPVPESPTLTVSFPNSIFHEAAADKHVNVPTAQIPTSNVSSVTCEEESTRLVTMYTEAHSESGPPLPPATPPPSLPSANEVVSYEILKSTDGDEMDDKKSLLDSRTRPLSSTPVGHKSAVSPPVNISADNELFEWQQQSVPEENEVLASLSTLSSSALQVEEKKGALSLAPDRRDEEEGDQSLSRRSDLANLDAQVTKRMVHQRSGGERDSVGDDDLSSQVATARTEVVAARGTGHWQVMSNIMSWFAFPRFMSRRFVFRGLMIGVVAAAASLVLFGGRHFVYAAYRNTEAD